MQMLTIRELSEASGWPQGRIRRLIEKGKLDHLPDDGLTLLPPDAIEKYVQQNLVKACLKIRRAPPGQHSVQPEQSPGLPAAPA